MYYERTIEPVIKKITETFPVLIVTGPRQVGKTTLLTRMAQKDRKIVSLDNPTIRAFAKSDPELFIQRYAPPVLIDEVQYAPELFDYIKNLCGSGKAVRRFLAYRPRRPSDDEACDGVSGRPGGYRSDAGLKQQ